MPIDHNDDRAVRRAELGAIAQWLAWARRAGVVTDDPAGLVSDLESRWRAVFESVDPPTGLALLEARGAGAIPEGVLFAHLVGMADRPPAEIARELFRWLERARALAGAGGDVDEDTDYTDLGVRAIRQLAYEEPKLIRLPPAGAGALFRGQYRGVPADRRGRHIDEPTSGRVPRPDDPRFQALVRALDAATRKARGRAEAARRSGRAESKRRAEPVSVVRHASGTASAGQSRRRRSKRRR